MKIRKIIIDKMKEKGYNYLVNDDCNCSINNLGENCEFSGYDVLDCKLARLSIENSFHSSKESNKK